MKNFKNRCVFLLFTISINIVNITDAQINVTSGLFTDTQDFNTLASTGTSSTLPPGWAFVESGSSANTTYTAGTGSSTTGDTYSFGLASNTERSLGGLQSGSLTPSIGVCYTNSTGSTITSLRISFTGETWRVGSANRTDRINFEYNSNTTAINGSGTWIAFPSLDYVNPGQTTGSGSMQHSAIITATITGLNIPANTTFCFRWVSFDASGSDDGIAIDDYTLDKIVLACPTLNTAPDNVSITNSTCTNCILGGGNISAPTNNLCPSGSTMQFSTNAGMIWSTTLPSYVQSGPPLTIITRCICNSSHTQTSPISSGVTTNPGMCPVSCVCPDFTNIIPNNVTITNSVCSFPLCNVAGGFIQAAVNNCPTGSTMQYSVDNGTSWSQTLPVYHQSGPPQNIITRCNCNSNSATSSVPSSAQITSPGPCPNTCACNPNCGTFPR
ncbi:MAG: hypothetical protein IPK35_12875 [Saprospiraceae bacterium]|nr:hypothetical protein [Saprospiraceae bacterium]